jgi:hypothetical protein
MEKLKNVFKTSVGKPLREPSGDLDVERRNMLKRNERVD